MNRSVFSCRRISISCCVFFIAVFFSAIMFSSNVSASSHEEEKQVGAFGVEENAQALRNELAAEGKFAFLRKKEAGGKTLYLVIVRVSGEASTAKEAQAPASAEEQVGVFSVEANAQALRNRFAAEGKFAFLRKKEVDGKTLYAVIVSASAKGTASMGLPSAETMDAETMEVEETAPVVEPVVEMDEAMESGVMEAESEPMDVSAEMTSMPEPAEELSEAAEPEEPVMPAIMKAVSHEDSLTPETPESEAEPEPGPEPEAPQPSAPMQPVGPDATPIKGMGIVFELFLPEYARIYEAPSFKSRRIGLRGDHGNYDVIGDSPEGWIVVRSINNSKIRYVPADDAKYYLIDRKGKRKKQIQERPEVR